MTVPTIAGTDCVCVLFFLLLNSVHCERKIVHAGEDILLPCACSYKPSSHLNVFWRYNETHNLYDIIKGNPDLSLQDPRFSNRTCTFPRFYAEGNFSVVLTNVSLNDTGLYDCDIPTAEVQLKLNLIVTVKPTEEPTVKPAVVSTEKPTPEVETTTPGGSASIEYNSLLYLLSLPVALWN